ncbi:MAG: SMP-30/gluconolactonase/LRE family protein [Pseudomonadota bacterium]
MLDGRALRRIGAELSRPECVLCHVSGLLIVSDWTPPGGVSLIAPDGRVTRLLATRPDDGVPRTLKPNGIALEDGGTVLLAHLGTTCGGIFRLYPDGRCELVTNTVDGADMPPTNFVTVDGAGRIWITVSTRAMPRDSDFHAGASGGFIACHTNGSTRLVADGLGYTNECVLSGDARTLYVNETFGRRLTAFEHEDGRLTSRRTVAAFGLGDFPDGVTLAEGGAAIVSSILSNRVIHVDLETGAQKHWMADADRTYLDDIEQAFADGTLSRVHLETPPPGRLPHISSVAFGGTDQKTAFVGTLGGACVYAFDAPKAGLQPMHWSHDATALLTLAGMV